MLPDRVSNPGPLTYESGALPIALYGRLFSIGVADCLKKSCCFFRGGGGGGGRGEGGEVGGLEYQRIQI